MKIEKLFDIIGSDFYTGVPDSQLRALCDFLMEKYGIDSDHHMIAANEGNCLGLAAGYHLATSKIPVVYMQNSGEGNIINPLASLVNDRVYAIPVIFIIGWRGQPGVHDEPQHIYQGIVTETLMKDMDVATFTIGRETTDDDVSLAMSSFKEILGCGKQVAFLIEKGALEFDGKVTYENGNTLVREEVIQHITAVTGDDPIISTTGKISRELFETRTKAGKDHGTDFLTVGSMGHCSSIALGVALNKPLTKVWCIDGDGALLMHMGSMAVIGANAPSNLVHIVLNNCAHETVGGMPTVAASANLVEIARACGYGHAKTVGTLNDLDKALSEAKSSSTLTFIEVKCGIASRKDLGRPTTSALENKINFMKHLENCK